MLSAAISTTLARKCMVLDSLWWPDTCIAARRSLLLLLRGSGMQLPGTTSVTASQPFPVFTESPLPSASQQWPQSAAQPPARASSQPPTQQHRPITQTPSQPAGLPSLPVCTAHFCATHALKTQTNRPASQPCSVSGHPPTPTCGPQQRALLQHLHHLLPTAHLPLSSTRQAHAAPRHLPNVHGWQGAAGGAQQVVDLLLWSEGVCVGWGGGYPSSLCV